MAFLCQRQPYLKTHNTRVKSCAPTEFKGKSLFKIGLEETIFFPEGGGQPTDYGSINEVKVEYVIREKYNAVIYCNQELEVGIDAQCILDWDRRFDHMQQHTAQHLISALLENDYKLNTTSWELGSDFSNIELDTSIIKLTSEIKKNVETLANHYIRLNTPVNVQSLSLLEATEIIQKFSRNGIPQDIAEPVRIIVIKDIDANMCCGTHVENLAQIQSIILLNETSTRGKTRLHFIAGNRVLKYLTLLRFRESALTSLIGNGPQEHLEIIKKMKKTIKLNDKEINYAIKELTVFDEQFLRAEIKKKKFVAHHRFFSDNSYLNNISRVLVNSMGDYSDRVILITSGGPVGMGMYCLIGNPDILHQIQPMVSTILEGKGSTACKNGRLQGKALKIENYTNLIKEIEKLMQ